MNQASDRHTHAIVGAGLAGAKAAEALREEGFGGRIVLIGEEPEQPYERPPLSKDYLRGESPREQARVHPDGADAIAARLDRGGRLVVIGAGWIGAEVAASARQKGLEVSIVERGELPLEHVLGREVGQIYADIHRDHGVEFVSGAALDRFEGGAAVERVRLADGRTLDSGFVVVGIGVEPRTRLAREAGIAVDDGIPVSERLETSVEGVFAVGDVANAQHPFYGRRLRVEHWANALNQPPTAARAMLSKPASYERLPYFFSDQYDVGMEYSGYAARWDEVVFRGDPAGREFIAFWLEAGRVVARMNVNVWDVNEAVQSLIRSRQRVAAERLRDPDVPLEEITEEGAS
jgi:3-phenylpropionate/trans-cinnamate dioxygenase ferredoxin reductase subunit